MNAVDDIRSSLDMGQVARYLGTDEGEASRLVDEALSSLVGQLDDNVHSAEGAVGVTRALLGDHAASNAYDDRIDLERVDAADGAKIVDHVYSPTQIQSLSSGSGGALLQKLLPILAPIVMAYLAKRLGGYLGGGTGSAGQAGGSGGIGDILGDLLGAGSGAPQQPSGGGLGGGLGDLLGGLLGGAGGGAPATPTPQPGPTDTGSGGFRAPTAPPTDIHIDGGTAGTTATPGQAAPRPQGGQPGDVLGGLLSDLLFGRR